MAREAAASVLRSDVEAKVIDRLNRDDLAAPLFVGSVAVDVHIYWERGPREVKRKDGTIDIQTAFRTRLDLDGAIGSIKPALDGLQRGIIHNDRQIDLIRVKQHHDIAAAGTMTMEVRALDRGPKCPKCRHLDQIHVWADDAYIGTYCHGCQGLTPGPRQDFLHIRKVSM